MESFHTIHIYRNDPAAVVDLLAICKAIEETGIKISIDCDVECVCVESAFAWSAVRIINDLGYRTDEDESEDDEDEESCWWAY